MNNLSNLLEVAIEASLEAGERTLIYYNEKNVEVDFKSDNSPLTKADLEANSIIEKKLKRTEIPILSEELIPDAYEERKNWEYLWIVDPLDGTKEFIKKSNEYTINIALIKGDTPILGVVYAPALDILYYGDHQSGAFKVAEASKKLIENILDNKFRKQISSKPKSTETVVVASKSHRNDETNLFLSKLSEKFEKVRVESFGSSLKLCMVAEGTAQIYPRLGPTMEWDTAASHAVVLASGAKIYQYPSFEPMVYNKENLLNPYFIVLAEAKEKAVKNI